MQGVGKPDAQSQGLKAIQDPQRKSRGELLSLSNSRQNLKHTTPSAMAWFSFQKNSCHQPG